MAGATYFFTVCLENRSSRFLVDHIDVLRQAYAKTIREFPITCHAMVILPDHLHAIWTLPDGDANFSERWRRIKGRFSHGIRDETMPRPSLEAKRERGIWQRRFWEHLVRDEQAFKAAMAYCEYNPVKHGLVGDSKDWPFSSFNVRQQ
uniref:REP-associated tyrosine transposase n=1 Tax=Neogemmobacter tilapiae TaxID=875041 RepID=UPI0027E3BADB|nr:transposase [Gemmobacter tilapiae]